MRHPWVVVFFYLLVFLNSILCMRSENGIVLIILLLLYMWKGKNCFHFLFAFGGRWPHCYNLEYWSAPYLLEVFAQLRNCSVFKYLSENPCRPIKLNCWNCLINMVFLLKSCQLTNVSGIALYSWILFKIRETEIKQLKLPLETALLIFSSD